MKNHLIYALLGAITLSPMAQADSLTDKEMHILASGAITAGGALFYENVMGVDSQKSWLYGAVTAFAIGVTKEIIDYRSSKGSAEMADIGADMIGIGMGLGAITISKNAYMYFSKPTGDSLSVNFAISM